MEQGSQEQQAGGGPHLPGLALRVLCAESVSDWEAATIRSFFPRAASLRVSLLTGDPEVLACLGSLLSPGPMRLALVPVRASASGAAVQHGSAVYLTAEARRGTECWDFEGGSVLALPLLLPAEAPPAAQGEPGTPQRGFAAEAAQPAACVGALVLSFPEGSLPLDALHARNLQLLAAAMAPGVQPAAEAALQHSDLILGVQPPVTPGRQAGPAEEGEAEEGEEEMWEGSSTATAASLPSELGLSDIEEGDEEGEVSGGLEGEAEGMEEGGEEEEEEEEEGETGSAAGQEGQGGGQAGAQPPQWAAGQCRPLGQPPDDPGASPSSAVLKAPQPSLGLEQFQSGPGVKGQAKQETEGRYEPESPSAAKARARAEAAALAAAAGPAGSGGSATGASGGSPQSSLGSLVTASSLSSQLFKTSPSRELLLEAVEGDGEGMAEQLAEAGASWRSLLRFGDRQMEARFAARHYAELWQNDVTSTSLALALQSVLLAAGRAHGGQAAWPGLLLLLANAALLAFMLLARHTYLRERDGLILWAYLLLAWRQACQGLSCCLAPVLLGLAFQGRFCLQAPLQALLLVGSAAELARMGGTAFQLCSPLSPLTVLCGLFAPASLASMLALYRLEARARACFLARPPPSAPGITLPAAVPEAAAQV